MSLKLILASTAALALIAGAPAQAAKSRGDQAVAAEGGSAGVKAKDEHKTCRFIDNSASRMKRERLCFTREQWKKFDEEQNR